MTMPEHTGYEWLDHGADRPGALMNEASLFASGVWTVLYQDNSFPQHVAESIAERTDVARAVIVFWNVNAVISFDYWERGVQIDGFSEWPSQRVGTDRSRLSADMNAVGLGEGSDDDESVDYNTAMLALADRITGEHLSRDFLSRPDIVLGSIPLD